MWQPLKHLDLHQCHGLSKALCPDDKICVAMGVRSVVAPTLNALFYALKGVYSALGSIGEVLLR